MSKVERDPERGRAVAAELKALGVKKRELIRAAEQGYITELACKMPECFCPEELGGASYFAQVTNDWSDWRSDWMPTFEHFPVYKKEGGKAVVENAILAHRLCNRLDHSLRVGRSHESDCERIRKAREEGIRRNNVLTGNTEGGEFPAVVAIVEATGEPVEETEPEAKAATPKPKKTKKAPEWKSLADAEKAQWLLDHRTISDRTWTKESRLKGEKRDAFIHRILGFPRGRLNADLGGPSLGKHSRTLAHGIVLSVDESNSPNSKSDSSDEAAITPYRARRPVRIQRTRVDRLDALESHIRLLRGYAQHAFEGGDSDYFGEVAAKLRLLVGEHGNKPLLLNLMDEMAPPITVTLGGPPIQPLPGRPGPGDQLTLREYLNLEAMTLRIPQRGLVSFTKAQLIDAWAQQVGAAHEDRAVDEELAHALFGGTYIGGLPAAAAELAVTTNTVLHAADRLLAAVKGHS